MNRGVGAGGTNTTKNGTKFEKITDFKPFLISIGFIIEKYGKYEYLFLEKNGVKYYWGGKNGFKQVMSHINKSLNTESFFRQPDEYFMKIEGAKIHLYIIEKKNQNTSGSVDIKLLAGPGIIENYRDMINDDKYVIHYRFVVNDWLYNEAVSKPSAKNISMKKHLDKYGIKICEFNPTYFQETWTWIE